MRNIPGDEQTRAGRAEWANPPGVPNAIQVLPEMAVALFKPAFNPTSESLGRLFRQARYRERKAMMARRSPWTGGITEAIHGGGFGGRINEL